MDLWGHNPFSARAPEPRRRAARQRLRGLLRPRQARAALDRRTAASPRKQRHLKLFLSEYSLPTDHANFEFNFFVTPQDAGEVDARRRCGSRAPTSASTPSATSASTTTRCGRDGDQVERGLLTRDGERKPAYAAFRDG